MKKGITKAVVWILIMGMALSTPAPWSHAADGEDTYVNFNFDQVELRFLVKLVSDMTGKRFVIDDSVAGKVSVVTPTQIKVSEVYPLFLSILESSGYSILQKGDAAHIIELAPSEIREAPVVASTDDEGDASGVITKIIRLQHISVIDLKKVLEPMVRGGKEGALAAFGPTNHLLITDTVQNIARLEKIIEDLDQEGTSRIVEVIRLEHASAEEMARQMNIAFQGAQSAATRFSRHVQQVTGGSGNLPAGASVVPVPHANALVLVGTPVDLAELKRIVLLMDVEAPSGYGRLNAIFLKYLSAEDAAKSLNALLAKTAVKDQEQQIAIEPSIPNNALIVDAAPRDFELVRDLVMKLDQVPQQVLVEVLIAEVSEGDGLDFGFEYSAVDQPAEGRTTVLGRTRLDETDVLMDALVNNVVPRGFTFGLATGLSTDPAGNLVPDVPVLVNLLAQNRDVRILSNIPLWAQNNKEASVSIVENIPILSSTIEGGSGTARDVIQNIERVDVGIKLTMTPHVNPDQEVLMELNPSIEAIIDEGSPDQPFTPTIAKREVSTTVTVPDSATVVISGLIREDRIEEENKIPVLGDIPLLGFFFKNKSKRKQRTNLLIFVTPHIVTDMAEAQRMKEVLEQRTQISPPSTMSLAEEPVPAETP